MSSEVGKGTTFWLNIPLKIEQGEPQTTVPDSTEAPQDVKISQELKVSDVKALVLCFCIQEICSILGRYLVGFPLEVQQVTTVAECIERGKHCPVWTIVLESGESGSEVLTQLKNEPSIRDIPVIMLPLEKGGISAKSSPDKIASIVQSVTLADKHSVLAVDDNEMNLNLMTNVLESAGYAVYKAKSAQKGIEIAEKVLPDAILMDVAMPGMDGFEATQILKQHPETSGITVIACSAFTPREYKDRAAQVGCEGYIAKPIEPNRLVEQVTGFILASKIRRKLVQRDSNSL